MAAAALLAAVLTALGAMGSLAADIGNGAQAAPGHAQPKPELIALPPNLDIPRYRPGPPPFRDGETLVYAASWEGVPAAEVRIMLIQPKNHPQWWTGQMWVNSSKVIDVLYRMRDYFREDFDRETWRPDDMLILQHEKKRRDEWRVRFEDDDHLVTSIKKNRNGRTWIREFSGGRPWGPFSGAMMALSLPLKPGNTYTFDVFSGGNRYVFAFDVRKRERITTALGAFNTLQIEPSVVWLSEDRFRSQARETMVWVTDDARHLPVRIEAAVSIGSIRADLVQVTNGNGPDLKLKPIEAKLSEDKQADPP